MSNNFTKHPDHIYFYRQNQPFGEFSNFYPASFVDKNGITWKTTEHFFQAKKFENTEHENVIKNLDTPGQAAKQGRSRSRPLRSDWEEVKENIMYECLCYKFLQNKDMLDILVSTGDKKLIEHTRNDRYWADGGDGTGKNRLGVLLMRLREEIKNGSLSFQE